MTDERTTPFYWTAADDRKLLRFLLAGHEYRMIYPHFPHRTQMAVRARIARVRDASSVPIPKKEPMLDYHTLLTQEDARAVRKLASEAGYTFSMMLRVLVKESLANRKEQSLDQLSQTRRNP